MIFNVKKLAVAVGVLSMLPTTVLAAAPGARKNSSEGELVSYSVTHPSCFLGDNYIELGISEFGTFNTL